MRLTVSGSRSEGVNQVFGTTLYAGNGGTQSIVSGIDLANKSGLLWLKARNTTTDHILVDTARGVGKILSSNLTTADAADADTVTALTATGFSLGADIKTNASYNYVSWSVKESRRFFDVSALTKAAGSNATITFPKLETLGMVIVKRTDATSNWFVRHRSLASGDLLYLNSTAIGATLGHVTVSGTTVTLVDGVIADGSYMVYAFAHDSHLSGKIQCGTYTGNGSTTGPVITLGWRPQFLIIKSFSGGPTDWLLYDNKRSTTNPRTAVIDINTTGIETDQNDVDFTTTGFQPKVAAGINKEFFGFVYLAIREA